MSFVAYFPFRWEIRKLLAVLPLSLWSNCRPKKSTGIRNQCKDVYLRACPMPDDAPVMRAYPVLSAALLPPIGEGGEAETTISTAVAAAATLFLPPRQPGRAGGEQRGRVPHPPPRAPTPLLRTATPASAFAVAIPLHCLRHHCGVVVVRLCCHHWFVLPSPETASVGELSTYSNVGIFLKVLCAGVFFKIC